MMINFKSYSTRLLQLTSALLVGLCWSSARADDAMPVPWNGMDIGSPQPAGTAKTDGGAFTLNGGGKLAATSDDLHFVYQSVSGDCSISARVTTPNNLADAGLIARDALATTSNYVAVVSSPGNGVESTYRTASTPVATTVSAQGDSPVWLKLLRRGAVVQNYVAADNGGAPGSWSPIGTDQPIATGMIYVGLFLTSHVPGTGGDAIFDHVSLAAGTQPVLDNGVYTITPVGAPNMDLTATGSAVNIASPAKSPTQKWRLVSKGNGIYSILLISDPSLALTVPAANATFGTKVTVTTNQGQDSQLWSLVANSNNTYSLLPKFNLTIGLDDYGGIATSDAVIDVWGYNNIDPHLQWTLNPVP